MKPRDELRVATIKRFLGDLQAGVKPLIEDCFRRAVAYDAREALLMSVSMLGRFCVEQGITPMEMAQIIEKHEKFQRDSLKHGPPRIILAN